MRGHDAVMNALPYYFNYPVAKAAVAAGLHCADLGGNTEIVQKQKTLHKAAQKQDVSVVPDCGLAPGMVNIIAAEGIRRSEEHTSELQSHSDLVCRLLLEKKNNYIK